MQGNSRVLRTVAPEALILSSKTLRLILETLESCNVVEKTNNIKLRGQHLASSSLQTFTPKIYSNPYDDKLIYIYMCFSKLLKRCYYFLPEFCNVLIEASCHGDVMFSFDVRVRG